MKYKLFNKIDKVWFGFTLGVVLPIAGFFLSKMVLASGANLSQYWDIFNDPDLEVNKDILVFSMLPSMLAFWVFYFSLKADKAAKGLVAATLLAVGFGVLRFL